MNTAPRPNAQDPRVIRTRQLIHQAFVELLQTKEFNEITVSDITRRATINRVTFYTHYTDKYELLEYMISTQLIQLLYKGIDPQQALSAEALTTLICALCNYHEYSSSQCPKNFDSLSPLVEKNMKSQLQQYILQQLTHHLPDQDEAQLVPLSAMISWSLYGATLQWNLEQKDRRETPQQLASRIVPLLTSWMTMSGIEYPISNQLPAATTSNTILPTSVCLSQWSESYELKTSI
ncbi:TetR family transcriptional regulator [Paenibacillus sp. WLX2291]|uniref:TetR family transcriptional regulator n=1 Tax=Paenibacillus sp. WLX2291 TaxID=3296934 RepID=UPI003984402A